MGLCACTQLKLRPLLSPGFEENLVSRLERMSGYVSWVGRPGGKLMSKA